jgi:ribosomal protection tetracycline resistance protein
MPTLNLGIVAHVDAGKTTLTERLLYDTGVITHIGSVDRGDTTTDTDALERQRGITIRSAVVTFTIGDVKVNLLDTPGHSDFVAEVERALGVLDGAVLVVSAVEGVQAQSRVLIRILEGLHIPFLVFANKIDRVGAAYDESVIAVRDALAGDAIALNQTRDLGTRSATVGERLGQSFLDELVERLAEHDDQMLSRYVDGAQPVSRADAFAALARLTGTGHLHPMIFGSALRGVGVADVIDALARFLPAKAPQAGKPLHASVFKIERGRTGHKVAYVRLHSGELAARDHVSYHRRSATGAVAEGHGRVTMVSTFTHGTQTADQPAHAGDIAKVVGLTDVEIGDQLGVWDPAKGGRHFAPPGLEAVVLARSPADRPALFEALKELAEQDPLIDTRLDGLDQELTVSLYGEVQKEVLAARLATEFGVDAEFLPTQTVYIERVAGLGTALKVIGTPGNLDLATVGLRVEPGVVDSGIVYRRAVELGGLLLSFHTAIEETVPATLEEGLHGWRVTDCVVTLTHSGYWAPVSAAGDFRRLTAIVLFDALRQAGTTVCEPFSEFEMEFPAASISRVLRKLASCGATPAEPQIGPARCRLTGLIPTAQVHTFEQRLSGLTQGEGVFFARPAGYQSVQGAPPTRQRTSLISLAVDGPRSGLARPAG